MWGRVLLFTLSSVAGYGQVVIGTVESIDRNQLRLKSGAGVVVLQTNEKTAVRKTKVFHDLSPLVAGDVVRANYYGEGPNMVAVSISVRVALTGVIGESTAMCLTVVPDSTGGVKPPDQLEKRSVFVSRQTALEIARKDLVAGRRIRVVGWDAGNGFIEAETIGAPAAHSPAPAAPPRPQS